MGIARDPKTTDMEDYEECNDESQKLLLSSAKRGRELYIYPENFVVVGNMKTEVRKFEDTSRKAQSSARAPSSAHALLHHLFNPVSWPFTLKICF